MCLPITRGTDMDARSKEFGEAISRLLDEIERNDLERAKTQSVRGMRAFSLDEMIAANERGDFYLEDPVGFGLRKGIRKAGEFLSKIGGSENAREVAEYAASRKGGRENDDENYAIRANIIDKHWDGLKFGDEVWIA